MASGYTDSIKDGITFRTFALRCARAFGACIDQREDDMDNLPKKQEVSTWHLDKIREYKKQKEKILLMGNDEIKETAKKEHERHVSEIKADIKRKKELKVKYDAMLQAVKRWRPPTADHEGLKNFMTEQIQDSVRWDCTDRSDELKDIGKPKTVKEWKAAALSDVNYNINYHETEYKNEAERVASRNDWIDKLYSSLESER